MRARSIVATAALAVATVTGTGTTAVADSSPQIQWVNGNVIVDATDLDQAYVTGKYRCDGGNDEMTHLWVSVKQGPLINTTTHTTSSDATSWYDTNWNAGEFGQPLTTIVCDGQWHVTRTLIKRVFFGWDGSPKGRLTDGPALIQFCAFDSDDTEEGGASSYTMGTVRVPSSKR